MRKILFLPLLIAMMAIALIPVHTFAAQENSRTVLIKKERFFEPWDPEEEGRRIPSRPLLCIINPEGIVIENADTSGIYQYDVCDLEGEIMVSFSSEPEFIQYVLSSTEEIGIRLYTEDYIYVGYLSD